MTKYLTNDEARRLQAGLEPEEPVVESGWVKVPNFVRVDEQGCVVLSQQDRDQLDRIEELLKKLQPREWVGGPK